MKIAVLDVTHAGGVLAEHYARAGHDVTAVDVYCTAAEAPEGCTLTRHAGGDFDLLIAPVHLPSRYLQGMSAPRIITHHEAAGEILGEQELNATIIEVTGTRSKTTAAHALAHLLQEGYDVVVNTSAGLFFNSRKMAHLSTAPGNILRAVELAEHLHPDVYIFEISLGGTKRADYGVLTTLEDEYLIAESTKPAGDAKLSTLFGEHTHPVVNSNTLERVRKTGIKSRVPPTTFGALGDHVYIQDNTLHYHVRQHSGSLRLPALFEPGAYKTGVEAAVATALHLITPECIQQRLSTFTGAPGRMQLCNLEGRIFIDNSNSGVRSEELDRLLKKASSYGRVFLIHGEDGKVCERLNSRISREVITKWQDRLLGVALIGLSMDSAHIADSIDDALEMALQHTTTNDVILSNVKCFR